MDTGEAEQKLEEIEVKLAGSNKTIPIKDVSYLKAILSTVISLVLLILVLFFMALIRTDDVTSINFFNPVTYILAAASEAYALGRYLSFIPYSGVVTSIFVSLLVPILAKNIYKIINK